MNYEEPDPAIYKLHYNQEFQQLIEGNRSLLLINRLFVQKQVKFTVMKC